MGKEEDKQNSNQKKKTTTTTPTRRATAMQPTTPARRATAMQPTTRQQTANHQQTERRQQQPPMRPAPPPQTAQQRIPMMPQSDVDNTPRFLGALQHFTQTTAQRSLSDLEMEFNRLNQLPRPAPSAEFAKNVRSNRYRDVQCVENNRVRLNNGHYIHANWINSNGEE